MHLILFDTATALQNLLRMFSSCDFCFCSKSSRKGTYAYEVFHKMPKFGGIFGSLRKKIHDFNSKIIGVLIGRKEAPAEYSIHSKRVPLQSLPTEKSNFYSLMSSNQDGVIKKVLKSDYEELLQEHAQSKQMFTDPDFPPNESSLGDVQLFKKYTGKCTWRRISQIIKHPVFVSERIEPNDILQGSLGDCYFLSAIAAIAENDTRIKDIFLNLEINEHGLYMARVLYRGVLTEVVVDDYVPVDVTGSPLFAKPAGGNEIWVMLLEKCWAKLNGSYANIEGGLPHEVLHAFTSAPTETWFTPSEKGGQNELWDKMWKGYSNGAILCCGTRREKYLENFQIETSHAYTILNLYQSSRYRMLKIRNPWGRKEWNGRASDKDKSFWESISPADRQQMGYFDKEDGVFFMLYEDFVKYYDVVDICKINDNASFTNVESEFNRKNAEIFEFEANGSGNLTIQLSQSAKRNERAFIQKNFAESVIIVARLESTVKGYEYKYVDSSISSDPEHYLELLDLPKGNYVIYAKYNWIYNDSDTAGVSIYSDSPAHLEKSSQSNHIDFLPKVFMDHARNNSASQQSIGNNSWACLQFIQKCRYGYVAVHLNQNFPFKVQVDTDERDYSEKGLVLKKPHRGQGKIHVNLVAGEESIILYRWRNTTQSIYGLPPANIIKF